VTVIHVNEIPVGAIEVVEIGNLADDPATIEVTSSASVVTIDVMGAINEEMQVIEVAPVVANRPAIPAFATFSVPGQLLVGSGKGRFIFWDSRTILAVYVSVATSPAGQNVVVDVNRNDITIFTNQANRPVVIPGANSNAGSVPDQQAMMAGDYITIDIDQVGIGNPGADLVVQIIYQ
jgi:hypothetical protein